MNYIKRNWKRLLLVGGVFLRSLVGTCVHAALIPSAGTLSSTEFTPMNAYAADITTIMIWVAGAIIAVVALSLLLRGGKKVLRKLSP